MDGLAKEAKGMDGLAKEAKDMETRINRHQRGGYQTIPLEIAIHRTVVQGPVIVGLAPPRERQHTLGQCASAAIL